MAAAALSADEAAVYDRQIRVWGVEAQKRLRDARVLVVGSCPLACELAKNVCLAGVGVLVLASTAGGEHDAANLLLAEHAAAVARGDAGEGVPGRLEFAAQQLQALNPRVRVSAKATTAAAIADDPAFACSFQAVCVLEGPWEERLRLARVARERKPAPACVYVAEAHGLSALALVDLGPEHAYSRVKPGGEGDEREEAMLEFPPAADVAAAPWQRVTERFGRRLRPAAHGFFAHAALRVHAARRPGSAPDAAEFASLRKELLALHGLPDAAWPAEHAAQFVAGVGVPYPPTAAVFGGVLAQEVIKTVSGKDKPLRNVLVFSALSGEVVERYVD